jgi:hypothetical protein
MQNKANFRSNKRNTTFLLTKDYEQITMNNEPIKQSQKLEANLPLRGRRSLRVSFSESTNRGPIKPNFGVGFMGTVKIGYGYEAQQP